MASVVYGGGYAAAPVTTMSVAAPTTAYAAPVTSVAAPVTSYAAPVAMAPEMTATYAAPSLTAAMPTTYNLPTAPSMVAYPSTGPFQFYVDTDGKGGAIAPATAPKTRDAKVSKDTKGKKATGK